MTQYTLTNRIRTLIESSDIPDDVKKAIFVRGWITHKDLIKLYRMHIFKLGQSKVKQDHTLLEFMAGSRIYRKPVVALKKTREFTELMEKLRLKQKELDYQKMVNADLASGDLHRMIELEREKVEGTDHRPSNVAKEVKSQLSTVINIMFTTISVAYAVWYWTGSSTNMSLEARVLCSLLFTLLALVAEVVVFSGYVRKVRIARVEERQKPGKELIVESIKFQDGTHRMNKVRRSERKIKGE